MNVIEGVKKLAPYVAAVGLCALALGIVLQLWRADLNIPFQIGGDAMVNQAFVKTLLEKGVYYHTDRTGAPFDTEVRDFPEPESLTFSEMRIMAWLFQTNNSVRIVNYFFLLTFFLTTLSALLVFRCFKVATGPALAASVLYAFVPYHFFRGEAHLFLTAYYLVPLTVMVALWLYIGRLNISWGRKRSETPAEAEEEPTGGNWKHWLFAVLVCLLVSSGGVYYAFFGCFFFLATALACAVRQRRLGSLFASATLVAVVSGGVALNLLPFLIYQKEKGANPMVAHRAPAEAEVYGLKMTELFLPVSGHRLPALRHIKEQYIKSPDMPLINDYGSGLGIIGVIGLVFALGAVLSRGRTSDGMADGQQNALALTGLGALIVCGLLLATIGGVGSLFAVYVSPMVRCYDRMSVFLSFMALFGAALLLDGVTRRLGRQGWMGRLGAGVLCGLVLVGGIFDQTRAADLPPYRAIKADHDSICGFTAAVEKTLPPGAMVLQLPYISFPEPASGPVVNMDTYDHFRMYLYSNTLRWSHGVMKGRFGADALARLCAAPIDESLEQFAVMGYQGIHIDRRGYLDYGHALEGRLSTLLGVKPLVSAEGRDVFFDVRPYAERLKNHYTESQWEKRRDWLQAPVWLHWGTGFQGRGEGVVCWNHTTGWKGEATVVNPLKEARPITLRFGIHNFPFAPTQLTLSGPLMEETLPVGPAGVQFNRTIMAPPGETPLHFTFVGPAAPQMLGLIEFNLANEAPPNPDEPVRVTTR